jgi:outer membrane protease
MLLSSHTTKSVSRLRFKVITVMTMKNAIFWDVMPRRSCKNQHFGGTMVSIIRVERISELGMLEVTIN